jgi:hypothetical protein
MASSSGEPKTNTKLGASQIEPFLFGLTRSSLAVEKDFASKPTKDWKTTPIDGGDYEPRERKQPSISAEGGIARTWHAFNQVLSDDDFRRW